MAWRRNRHRDPAYSARRLRGTQDWQDEQALLAELIGGRPAAALEIARALDDDLRRHGFDVAIAAVRRFLLEQVTRETHDEATAVAIELGTQPGPVDPAMPDPEYQRARNAMQLAGTRPVDELIGILGAQHGALREDPEFGLLLAHELVVRGVEVPSTTARPYVDWARESGHDLALLPTTLLTTEQRFPEWLPHYGGVAGASSQGVPDRQPANAVRLADLIDGLGREVAVDTDSIRGPFNDWIDHSNGQVEVHAYEPGDSFLEDLPEPRLSRDRSAGRLTPGEALEQFFSASVLSGAYSRGPGGAYSRLRAWQACAALVGHDWPAELSDLATAIERAGWYQIGPNDPWFCDVAWDIWLIVEAAGRLVVIAATDTD